MKNNFVEEKIIITGKYDIGATITIPQNGEIKKPAVVLISGTGPTDRNGNTKKFFMNLYKDLSDFFASLGFVTIRYDKRGIGDSKGDFNGAGLNDLVDDVLANVNYLSQLDYVNQDKILLCGHSEGAMIATIASTKQKFAGLILIAGAGTTLRSALNYQNWMVLQEIKLLKGFKGFILSKLITEKNYLRNLNKFFEKCCGTDKDVIRIVGIKTSAKWIREHDKLTVQEMIEILTNAQYPILAVTGAKDVQANPQDIEQLAQLQLPHIKCQIIPNMDHMLRKYEGELTVLNLKKQYKLDLSHPIYEDLLLVIKTWIIEQVYQLYN